MIDKRQARACYRNRRRALTGVEKTNRDRQIVSRILAWEIYRQADRILLYAPLVEEADITPVIVHALAAGKVVGLPRVRNERGEMDFYRIDSQDSLEKGHFGVLEPKNDCVRIDAACSYPLCLVPGIAFDMRGGRLGYGKGYYDRFLAAFSGIGAGVTYADCLCPALPLDEHDACMDFLISEQGICALKRG